MNTQSIADTVSAGGVVTPSARKSSKGMWILLLLAVVAAFALISATPAQAFDNFVSVVDDEGANDEPGQKDLTKLEVDDGHSGLLYVNWQWDDIAWSGNNTGDACVLLDTDDDGLVNFALCVTLVGSDVDNRADQASNSPRLYQCDESPPSVANRRCTSSVLLKQGVNGVIAGNSTACSVVIGNDDPFPAGSPGGEGDAFPEDTVAECVIDFDDLPNGTPAPSLLNVCSYPSQIPNSDPSDCVVTPGSAFLTLIKSASPNDSTQWAFTLSPAANNGSTNFNRTGSGTVFALLPVSSTSNFTITETLPAGWDLTNATCSTNGSSTGTFDDANSRVTAIDTQPGQTTSCTFTNVQAGSITIVKDVNPEPDIQDFGFTTTGTGLAAFTLDDDGNEVDNAPMQLFPSSKTFNGLAPGSYTVTEGVLAGYDLMNLSCTGATNGTTGAQDGVNPQKVNVSLTAGGSITCTFTNEKDSSIKVVKETVPAVDATEFSFTDTIPACVVGPLDTDPAPGFTLCSDVDPNTGSSFYEVAEDGEAGYDLTNIVCTGDAEVLYGVKGDAGSFGATREAGDDAVHVFLDAAENVVCTFTNTKDGSIKVTKETDPTGDPQSFDFDPDYTNDFSLTDGQSNTESGLQPGTYSVSETVPTGWVLQGIVCETVNDTANGGSPDTDTVPNTASIDLEAGEQWECTFTNANEPNVKVEKTGSDAVSAGEPITFTITVTNEGPGKATNVTLKDVLPTNITDWALGTNDDEGDCSIGDDPGNPDDTSGTLACDFGDLDEGASKVVKITGTTDSADCQPGVENTAIVSADNEPQENLSDNESTADTPVNCPDLSVVKEAGADPIDAGEDAVFTITVSNAGPGEAKDVELTDDLPAGISWVLSGADAGDCLIVLDADEVPADGNAGDTLECDFGDIADDGSRTVTLTGETDPADCGTLSNTAVVSLSNGEGDSSTDTILVNCPDLSVVKEAGADPIDAGEDAVFTITVSNAGPGEAKDVELTDDLPAGISWVLSGADAGDCLIVLDADEVPADGNAGDTLECDFGDLDEGASKVVKITGTTDSADCQPGVENTAIVSASNGEGESSTDTILVNCPDLSVVKEAGADPIDAGEDAVFTITVSNAGPGEAKDVELTDDLPAGISWVLSGADAGDCLIVLDADEVPADGNAGDTLECDFGDIADDGSRTVTLTGETDPADCGTLSNTAVVSLSNGEGDSSTDTILVNCPDLSVVKEAGADPIDAGEDAVFSITVSNAGPGEAKDVELTDDLPAGISWVLSGADAGDCLIVLDADEVPADGNAGDTLECDFGDIADDGSRTVTLTGETDPADCGTLSNTAVVSLSNGEGDSSTDTILVNCPDLSVVKEAGADPIDAGEDAVFTITVSNAGPGEAKDVVLTDDLPAGISWVLSGADAGDCLIVLDADEVPADGNAGDTLECDFGDIADDGSRTVTLTGETDSADCGTLSNTAVVSLSNGEGDSSTDTILVNCGDIDLEKEADAGAVTAGDPIGFTITASNNGAGKATGVVMRDVLPNEAGLQWSIDVANTDPTCMIIPDGGVDDIEPNDNDTLRCEWGDIAGKVGDTVSSKTVHITSPTTAATPCGAIPNTASVTSSNDGSDEATDSVTVDCPSIVVDKTADESSVPAGDEIGFRITVTNNGVGAATNVVMKDALPNDPGLDWSIDQSQDGSPATCVINGDPPSEELECTIDLLASKGGSFTVHVVSDTTEETCGEVQNVKATVEVGNDGIVDSDGASVQVFCPGLTVVKSALEPTIEAGDTAIFDITVRNVEDENDPIGVAENVTLTDNLPDGIDWADNSDDCTITPDSGTVGQVLECSFGDMAPGDEVTVRVSGITDKGDCGTLVNRATVEFVLGTGPEEELPPVEPVTESLPEDPPAEDPPAEGQTTETTETTARTLGEDPPAEDPPAEDPPAEGEPPVEEIVVQVEEQETRTVDSNEATIDVNCPQSPPPPPPTPPQPAPAPVIDLSIVKVDLVDPVTVGDNITYELTVANAGPNTATDVKVTDIIPTDKVTFVSATPQQGTCSYNNPELTCQLGTLNAGASTKITVVVTANVAGIAVNQSMVTGSGGTEANLGNNNENEQTTIEGPFTPPSVCANLRISKKVLTVGQRSTIVATARDQRGKRMKGVRVNVAGPGIRGRGVTNAKGVVRFNVTPRSPGIVRFVVPRNSVCSRRVGVIGVFQPPVTG